MSRHHPNVNRVPDGAPNEHDNPRKVFIASRPVGGPASAWAFGTVKSLFGAPSMPGLPPSPANHWAIIVGDFYHQLQATSLNGGWNYYDNDRWSSWGGWDSYEVGKTTYNDVSIKIAAEKAMNALPEQYHWRNNNCQSFVCALLDLIAPGRKKVVTSYSFPDGAAAEEAHSEEDIEAEWAKKEMLERAKFIMDEKTPKVTDEGAAKLEELDAPIVLKAPEAGEAGALVEGSTTYQPPSEGNNLFD